MENISNRELRERLISFGYNPPPVTDTSRDILLKKLKKLESSAPAPPSNGNISIESDKYEVKSRKTRSSAKTQDSPEKNDFLTYKNFGLDKSLTRQTRNNKTDDEIGNSYDAVDSTTSGKKTKTSTPYVEGYSSKTRDPFEKGSDSDESISLVTRSTSSLARKPLNVRRESEYYSTVRTPPGMYRKFETDNGASSYLNRDIYRAKSPSSSKSNWSKMASKVSLNKITPSIVLLAFVLFFVIVAGIYFSKNDRVYGEISLNDINYQKCSERKRVTDACIPDDELEGSLKCFKTVYQALWKNEANQVCVGKGATQVKSSLSPENITELLVIENSLLRYEADRIISNIKVLANVNPQLGVRFKEFEGFRLDNAELPWRCAFKSWFSVIFDYALIVAAAVPLLLSMHILFRWGVTRHQERAKDKQELIKGILEILQQTAITNPTQNYLPIVHVRDQLITYEDRERKKKVWAEAVKYVEENESRIRREVQPYQGEDYDVWRWVGGNPMSMPKPKTWHGEAFETSKDTMNTPSISPTPCLKIRNMFDPKNETPEEDWVTGVKDAILERCEGVNVIHMVVDETNPEGCVYIKCASTDDAGKAYKKMHGAWFDGKIVSVKYLRLERYHERFPSSVGLNKPLIPSNDQKRSIV